MDLKRIQNWAIIYMAVWTISPPLFASMEARVLMVIAVSVWALLELLRSDGLAHRITLPVILTLLFIVYTGIVEIMLSGVGGLIMHVQMWIMLFFLIVWQSRRDDLQSLVPVFWAVLVIYPIWLFITIRTVLTENSHAARIIVRSSEEATELIQQGVGGYALVYGTLLLIPGLFGLARNRNVLRGPNLAPFLRKRPRLAFWVLLLNIGLGVALVLTAGFSIAVVALVGILISLTFLKTFDAPRLWFTFITLLIFAVLARPILETVLTALLPFADGMNFANKIRDVLASLELGAATGTLDDRTERYLRSLALFAENPLIGVLSNADIGKHSEVIDSFARWGIVFGGIFLYLVAFPVVRLLRRENRDFGVALAMFAAIVIIFWLNHSFASAGLMLYIMFPVAIHMIRAGRKRGGLQNAAGVNA